MNHQLSLSGIWQFCLDQEKKGLEQHYEQLSMSDNSVFSDTIHLPNTVAYAQKGTPGNTKETGYLTEPYKMEGYSWYRREISLPFSSEAELNALHFHLKLERTRISYLWVDGSYVGTFDSFMAPHIYDLTGHIHSLHPVITLMISNTDYKVPGGHMTSPDTQTNWNGILGDLELYWDQGVRIVKPSIVSDVPHHALSVSIPIENDSNHEFPVEVRLSAKLLRLNPAYIESHLKARLCNTVSNGSVLETELTDNSDITPPECHTSSEQILQTICVTLDELPGDSYTLTLPVGRTVSQHSYDLSAQEHLWSEYHPELYALTIQLYSKAQELLFETTLYTGQKTFETQNGHFIINGTPTFLRGKHDGMVFPLTGFAPMSVEGWLSAMYTAKAFGINHYRFHTCCPPEAAFLAADLLGIYMQPELPFWGTFHGPEDEDYNEEAQNFLRQEGFYMLEEFASHPSYCMMSMGNELWGNPAAINELLKEYKTFRPHILYTQGSNNFQWTPNIQPYDDFFSGVRFTIDRQIRGSYAMCDKPLGHVQLDQPGTRFNYEEAIHPSYQAKAAELSEDGTIEIQYGTGVKRVKLTEVQEELNPSIPVVSHEIGQYCTYPDFNEIPCYTGVLKAENFSIFQERLAEKHLDHLSHDYFVNSGALAVSCYKDELETALRTPSLAGFQILDLQDFPGQGTALVGVLNAFMQNKGLVSASDWREFCSDAVVQAEFDSYIVTAGSDFSFTASLSYYREEMLQKPVLAVSLTETGNETAIFYQEYPCDDIPESGYHQFGSYAIPIPDTLKKTCGELRLSISILNTDIHNHYSLWYYPSYGKEDFSVLAGCPTDMPAMVSSSQEISKPAGIAYTLSEALTMAKDHDRVLLFLPAEDNTASIEGTYCTDFWCYPMFRSISESIGKEIPVGTLGLFIQKNHPALSGFPTKSHTTPQWFSIVSESRSTILDSTEIMPIVQTIDNFERNHRLGLIYEVQLTDLDCTLLICTSNLPKLMKEEVPEAYSLYQSLSQYLARPETANMDSKPYSMTSDEFRKLLTQPTES